MIHSVAKKTIAAAGGAQTVSVSNTMCKAYHVSFRSIAETPLAGSTSVEATATGGTKEVVRDASGVAMNIDPTAPESFTIRQPIESITLTPSSWTADVEIVCEILGEVG